MKRKVPFLSAVLILLTLASCRTGPPKVVQAVAPIYPQIARIAHIDGVVIISVEIGPDGKVLKPG